jgi:hypothetical protein
MATIIDKHGHVQRNVVPPFKTPSFTRASFSSARVFKIPKLAKVTLEIPKLCKRDPWGDRNLIKPDGDSKSGNDLENYFATRFLNSGYTPQKAGYPDFLMEKDGKYFWVEVKSNRGIISLNQERMFALLEKLFGLPVYIIRIWDNEALVPWRKWRRFESRGHKHPSQK